jgi:hypothetical protein
LLPSEDDEEKAAIEAARGCLSGPYVHTASSHPAAPSQPAVRRCAKQGAHPSQPAVWGGGGALMLSGVSFRNILELEFCQRRQNSPRKTQRSLRYYNVII